MTRGRATPQPPKVEIEAHGCAIRPRASSIQSRWPLYRAAPHNIEAEQALLGAILVNNEAFYRVSDFLEPMHFFEPLHQQIFELAASLIRAGKVGDAGHAQDLPAGRSRHRRHDGRQYLARLAAEATTIINAEDYGRTIYDLAIRRALILIGEDMVNVAYDAPVDFAPQEQIEDAERRLYELAETGHYDSGFQRFAHALTTAIDMAAHAYKRDGKLSGIATGLRDLDRHDGRPAAVRPDHPRRPPGMGKTALATNIAFNVAKHGRGEVAADGRTTTIDGGIVGFFSLEMSAEQLATRIIAEQAGIPSHKIRRGRSTRPTSTASSTRRERCRHIPLYIDQTGGLSIAQLAARARRLKRQRGLDLLVIDYIQLLRARAASAPEPRAGSDRDHHQPQGAGQGTERPDPGAVAALAPGRKPRRQAPAALRPA